ncbi:hypothetical protein [Embleya sp. NPDC059237]|uniref:hypothetical protein n=1 Tax=Embleya sp. NPDC059237 TaxID=3346784 RepID=UPI00369CFBBA
MAWRGVRTGRIATNAAAGVAVLVLAVIMTVVGSAGVNGPLTTRRWVLLFALASIGLVLALAPAHLAHTQTRRRIEMGPDALVLHDAYTTVALPWDTIAGSTLTLRPGRRPDAGTVRLDVRLRDGTPHSRSMYYVEEAMFRDLALDLYPGTAASGAGYTVCGPRTITDEISAPEGTHDAVPPAGPTSRAARTEQRATPHPARPARTACVTRRRRKAMWGTPSSVAGEVPGRSVRAARDIPLDARDEPARSRPIRSVPRRPFRRTELACRTTSRSVRRVRVRRWSFRVRGDRRGLRRGGFASVGLSAGTRP